MWSFFELLWQSELWALAMAVGVGVGARPCSIRLREWCEVWMCVSGWGCPSVEGEPPCQNGGDGIRQEAPRSSTLEPGLAALEEPWLPGLSLAPQQEWQCWVQEGLLKCGLPEPKAAPLRPVCISLSLFLPLPPLCLQRNRLLKTHKPTDIASL